jgi:hypothetical protein
VKKNRKAPPEADPPLAAAEGVRVIIASPLILAFSRKGRRNELTRSADQKWYRTGSFDIEIVNKYEEQL